MSDDNKELTGKKREINYKLRYGIAIWVIVALIVIMGFLLYKHDTMIIKLSECYQNCPLAARLAVFG